MIVKDKYKIINIWCYIGDDNLCVFCYWRKAIRIFYPYINKLLKRFFPDFIEKNNVIERTFEVSIF